MRSRALFSGERRDWTGRPRPPRGCQFARLAASIAWNPSRAAPIPERSQQKRMMLHSIDLATSTQ